MVTSACNNIKAATFDRYSVSVQLLPNILSVNCINCRINRHTDHDYLTYVALPHAIVNTEKVWRDAETGA